MRKNKRGYLAIITAALLAAGSFSAYAGVCSCPYGYNSSGGPGGNGACTCLEDQGPNGSGVCQCSMYNTGGYNTNNNPAYNTGWSGGPGKTGNNPGDYQEKRQDEILSKGPGSEEASNLINENQNGYYIFGDTYMGGTWEALENGGWKLKKDNGGYVSSQWAYVDGKTYLIDYDGTMLTGFRKVNDKWYYFNSTGAMQTGWLLKNGKYYFLNADGSMAYGWVNSQGLWYYLDTTSGVMMTNAYTPDGRYVNAEGVLV